MKKRLFLFRHGETDWNIENRMQGHLDIPLNQRGKEQSRELAASLVHCRLEVILSSDLKRAAETAQIVSQIGSVPIIYTEKLREAYLGDAQEKRYEELDSIFGVNSFKNWFSTEPIHDDMKFPRGESKSEALSRALEFLNNYVKNSSYGTIGVSTHGFLLLRLLTYFSSRKQKFTQAKNCQYYEVIYDNGVWSLV